MSATGRGAERRENDFYETPAACTQALVVVLRRDIEAAKFVLDPCCGDRAILRVLDSLVGGHNLGIDIDPRRQADIVCDALGPMQWGCTGQVVITNPPYKHAEAFARRALHEVGPSGTVAMLLRLPFLASRARFSFHRAHPSDVYVFAKRPSFTGDGKTDATEYAWFVWGPGRGGNWFVLDG